MNWYFKHEASGGIAGPMTEREARDIADSNDGIVFSEQIWSPPSEETKAFEKTKALLIRGAEQIKQIEERPNRDLNYQAILDVLIETMDVIKILSGIAAPEQVASLLRELLDIKAMVSKSHDSTDDASLILSFCDEGEMGKFLQQAIDMILSLSLSAKKFVAGSLDAGILEISEVSPGVTVLIDDYDIQGMEDDPRISEDDDGRPCCKREFGD